MHAKDLTIEERVERLCELVEALSRRVAELEGGAVKAGGRTEYASGTWAGATLAAEGTPPSGEPADPEAGEEAGGLSDEMIRWASGASLFPRLAALCFLLAIALILRTVTDNGIVDPLLGMGLGMGYAAALMAAGGYQYRRDSSLAPVFVACGAILMASIVVETHTRFRSLPLVPAYWTLMATGAAMAVLSRRFAAFLPVSVGTLAMCLAGAAIDYPNPFFPYLFMILLTANVLGYYAGTLKRCGWLRWIVLAVTAAMLLLWEARLAAVGAGRIAGTPALAPGWFPPVLAVLTVALSTIAFLGIVRGRGQLSAFDACLPTISAIGAYLAARTVIGTAGEGGVALGLAAILFALLHVPAAHRLALRKVDGSPGVNSFVVAGSVLLYLALPPVLGGALSAAALGAAAVCVAILSERWVNGAVRVTSYLLQVSAVALLAFSALADGRTAASPAEMASAGALAVFGLIQYRWCRRHAAPARSAWFGIHDRGDASGAATLLAGLTAAFLLLRGVAWRLLAGVSGGPEAFHCAQSIIVNLAALGLGLYAFRVRNREIRNVAILVIAAGAVGAAIDLFAASGVPLVLSVLAFGLAAATQSIALSRWQRSSHEPARKDVDPDGGTASALGE